MPLPEGRSYLGFIFARAAEPSEVVAALRAAHERLQFRIDKEVPLVSLVLKPGAWSFYLACCGT